MTEKRDKPIDVQSVNPRYKGAMLSDVVKALMRPSNPKARETLDRLQATDRPVNRQAESA